MGLSTRRQSVRRQNGNSPGNVVGGGNVVRALNVVGGKYRKVKHRPQIGQSYNNQTPFTLLQPVPGIVGENIVRGNNVGGNIVGGNIVR